MGGGGHDDVIHRGGTKRGRDRRGRTSGKYCSVRKYLEQHLRVSYLKVPFGMGGDSATRLRGRAKSAQALSLSLRQTAPRGQVEKHAPQRNSTTHARPRPSQPFFGTCGRHLSYECYTPFRSVPFLSSIISQVPQFSPPPRRGSGGSGVRGIRCLRRRGGLHPARVGWPGCGWDWDRDCGRGCGCEAEEEEEEEEVRTVHGLPTGNLSPPVPPGTGGEGGGGGGIVVLRRSAVVIVIAVTVTVAIAVVAVAAVLGGGGGGRALVHARGDGPHEDGGGTGDARGHAHRSTGRSAPGMPLLGPEAEMQTGGQEGRPRVPKEAPGWGAWVGGGAGGPTTTQEDVPPAHSPPPPHPAGSGSAPGPNLGEMLALVQGAGGMPGEEGVLRCLSPPRCCRLLVGVGVGVVGAAAGGGDGGGGPPGPPSWMSHLQGHPRHQEEGTVGRRLTRGPPRSGP